MRIKMYEGATEVNDFITQKHLVITDKNNIVVFLGLASMSTDDVINDEYNAYYLDEEPVFIDLGGCIYYTGD